MENYEQVMRERVIPVLEEMTCSLGLWERKCEDAFSTGIAGDYGLPIGVYDVIVVRTGEVTANRLGRKKAIFSVFDDRGKAIYSALEQLERSMPKSKRLRLSSKGLE